MMTGQISSYYDYVLYKYNTFLPHILLASFWTKYIGTVLKVLHTTLNNHSSTYKITMWETLAVSQSVFQVVNSTNQRSIVTNYVD